MVDRSQQEARSVATLVVGMGATGWSCARYLQRLGVPFAVVDSREDPPYRAHLEEQMPDVDACFGSLTAQSLQGIERLLLSPGVQPDQPLVREALRRGIEVLGDVELFARAATAPVLAVTGSNGKSTVTTLLGRMAEQDGRRTAAGGNLGTPALDLLGPPEPQIYVLELSSFQLESVRSLRPAVSVLLNISHDHMDRYASLADYAAAKARIHRGAAHAVVNADDPLTMGSVADGSAATRFTLGVPGDGEFGLISRDGAIWLAEGNSPLMQANDVKLQGRHNLANALAALAAGSRMGFAVDSMRAVLSDFGGLPHRCQLVANRGGVRWINDSKGTNVGATCAALQGFGQPNSLILIAGGVGKGADFTPLAHAAAGRVRLALLFGQDADALARALGGVVVTRRVADLAAAVGEAAGQARAGDVVLFSPACASFDMFENFAARGEAFAAAVLDEVHQ